MQGRPRGATDEGRLVPTEQDEPGLIQRLKAGDHEAFEVVFHRYGKRVYHQAFRLVGTATEAEEVVQEVFLTLYAKAHTFRGDAAFATWLYRLTVNAALTRLRRHKKAEEISIEDYLPRFQADGHHAVRPIVDWSQDLENHIAREELQRLLRQAIDQLAPLDKAVVVLSDLDGMPDREIGATLGLSVSAIKARLHRARLFLRGRLAASLGSSTQ